MTTLMDHPDLAAIEDEVITDIVEMTPEWAAEILERNTNNRPVGQHLGTLKASLRRGEWALNGEAIKIAKDETLLDGQHRLMACVQTGIPFRTLIVYGLSPETQDTMDSGKSRSRADVLKLNGYTATNALAAAVTAVIVSEQSGLRAAFNSSAKAGVTTGQVKERLEAEPGLVDVVHAVRKFGSVGLAGRTAAVLYRRLHLIDVEDAAFFFERLHQGDGLQKGNPILALRNQLVKMKQQKGTKSQTHVAALVIKAWNKYRAGEQATLINYRPGGATPEAFPEPR